MKKLLTLVVLPLVLCAGLAGQDIQERLAALISPAVAVTLVREGALQRIVYRQKNAVPELSPKTPLGAEMAAFLRKDMADGNDLPFISETVYLYEKPENRRTEPGADIAAVSVILRSVSRLKNTEYYSHTRKKMRILFEKSYAVDNPRDKNPIPDPVGGSGDGLTVPVLQKDLTFGEYVYEYRYRCTDTEAAYFSKNLESFWYGIFRLIKPENLRISILVHDLGDYLLVYGLTGADFFSVPGMEQKLRNSFTSRSDAIYDWFIREYQ
jgi:hypothetical protein